jgi:FixJ family two-component response regulator
MFARQNLFIYVVDDDDDARDSTLELLQSAGSSVRAFASGREFLENYDSSQAGCVIVDLQMPDISGFQVLDTLRALGNTVPVIIFTGRADPATKEFAERSGAVALLAKPVDHNELIELVQRLTNSNPEESRRLVPHA